MVRIVELLPGSDAHVQTAKVIVMAKKSETRGRKKSASKDTSYKTRIVTRPPQRLYPLEVRKADEEPQLVAKVKSNGTSIVPTVEENPEKGVITKSGRKISRPRR